MNKKVLSAILFGALMAGTGTFTSCIDNDEPAGIEELRGAKAELLRAKAAVEAAKVALVNAQAAAAQAEADLQKALAAAAQAESAAEIAKLQAEAEIAIANAEKIRKEADAAYQKAIIDVKKAQAELVGEQASAIQAYVTAYDNAYDAYNEAVDAQTTAQRNLANHLSVEEEKEAKKELFTRELAWNVTMGEKTLEGYKTALAEAQAELAAAKELEPHTYAEKVEELEAKRKEIILAVADLSIEAAEKMYGFYESGRVKELQDLWKAYTDLTEEEQTIPAFELEFGDGTGLPLWWNRTPVAIEEQTYSDVNRDNYVNHDLILEYYLNEFKSWTRDENDNAWTKEAIVKMEGDLAKFEEQIEEAKKAWSEAVAAFNTEEYNTSDPSKISGYTELVAALTAYNTAATEFNTASAAVAPLNTEAADKKAMNDAIAANQKTYAAAEKAAKDAQTAALKDDVLTATVKAQTEALTKAVTEAAKALATAEENVQKELDKATPDADELKVLNQLVTKAEENLDKATDALAAYSKDVEIAAINKAYTDAEKAAKDAQTKADAAATKAYNDKWNETNGTGWAAIKAAKEVVAAKNKVVTDAKDALVEAAKAYNENISEVIPAPIKLLDINIAFIGKIDLKTRVETKSTIELEKLLKLNKDALVDAVKNRSAYLFGTSWYERNAYGDFEARLKELTTEQIAADIAELEITSFFDYESACSGYGLLGQSMALAERIRIAKSWLENGEQIAALIKKVEEAHDALHAADEAYLLEIEEAYAAYEEACELFEADALATIEPIEAKRAEMEPLAHLYRAYIEAIRTYQEQGEYVTAEQIEKYIEDCEQLVADWEEKVYTWETTVMWAKENLEKWNAGGVRMTEILEAQLAQATVAVERAYEKLQVAQERLSQAMEALKWTAAE